MIFDSTNLFSDEQAVTASAASTNLIDLGAPGTPPNSSVALVRDIALGVPVPITVRVTTTFATLTSLKVAIQTDGVVNFGSPVTVNETEAIAAASLVAGYEFTMNYIPKANERYLRLYYTVAGDDATAGKVTAGIVASRKEGKAGGV